ncbi:MAG: ribonuclease R [Deltaproteobacteria bacterium]|nr:MAG: ribonuclease R [Deltaproteobacteria bacterium]
MVTTEQILALLERRRGKSLTLRDLQSAFDLDAGGRKALSRHLKQLERDGVLVTGKRGGYALAGHGRMMTGRIALHRDGYAFVSPDGSGEDNLFVPARFVRPAMDGDRVLVGIDRNPRDGRPEGRVVRVVERAHATLLGRFERTESVARIVPLAPELRESFLVARDGEGGADDGDVVIARIETYPGRVQAATARVVEVLGAADDPRVEIRVAVERFGLPYLFPPAVQAAAAALPARVDEADLANREDLRHLPFVTIDGETARDFDDAVAVARLPDGAFRLWVAIADVSHYVAAGGVIDREALNRGTSVYFPGSCLPMLPESLSNGICSLNPRVDRLVMVAELDFDGLGKRHQARFYAGVIHSRARLTYTEVAAILVDRDPELRAAHESLVGMLEVMGDLAGLRIARRHERGSLDFDLPEAEIVLDLRGRPEQIVRSERNLAHRLIEEFMLAANEAVAEWLDRQRSPVVFRIHEPPSEEKLAAFQEFIAHFNQGLAIPVEGVKPKLLQELLERVAGLPEEKLINHVLLRSLPQARYAVENRGHFGLAADCYCHFTSPIRRYPDLAVHRLLRRQLQLPGGFDRLPASLEEVAERSSFCERRAMEAERDIVSLKKCQFMQGRIGEECRGFVSAVQPFGFFVELEEIFVEGLVHVSSLADDYYQFDEATHSLTGMSRRRRFTVGDPVVVSVRRVDPDRREIDFRLAGEQPPPPPRRLSQQAKRGSLSTHRSSLGTKGVPRRRHR